MFVQDLETKMGSATEIKVDLERLANDMRSGASSYENEMQKAKAGLSNDLQSVGARRQQLEECVLLCCHPVRATDPRLDVERLVRYVTL